MQAAFQTLGQVICMICTTCSNDPLLVHAKVRVGRTERLTTHTTLSHALHKHFVARMFRKS